jgi:hypothetical protein
MLKAFQLNDQPKDDRKLFHDTATVQTLRFSLAVYLSKRFYKTVRGTALSKV